MDFEAEIFHELDEGDTLASIVVAWAEPRFGRAMVLSLISFVWFVGGLFLTPAVLLAHLGAGFVLLLVWTGGIWAFRRLILRFGCARRTMHFGADGAVFLPQLWDDGWLAQSDVMSIASERCEFVDDAKNHVSHVVKVYTSDGEVYEVTGYMLRVHAHKVAVLLTRSLQDMRACIAGKLRGNHLSERRSVAAMID